MLPAWHPGPFDRAILPSYTSTSPTFFLLLLSFSFFAATPIQRGGTAYPPQTRLTLAPGHFLHLPASHPRHLFTSRPSVTSFLPSPHLSSFADFHSNHYAAWHRGSRLRTVPRCQPGGSQTSGDPMEGYHGPFQAKKNMGALQRIVSVCFFHCHCANFGRYPAGTTQQTWGLSFFYLRLWPGLAETGKRKHLSLATRPLVISAPRQPWGVVGYLGVFLRFVP